MQNHRIQKSFSSLLLAAVLLAACGTAGAEPTTTPPAEPAIETATTTLAPSATETATATLTPTATETLTPTISPTYVESLRAKVIVDGRLACRFGPGAPYLFKFSFAGTATIELLVRMEHSDWVLARAVGGTNRCWVNGGPEFLQIDGDPMSLAPVDPHIVLAWSPYYGAMGGVSASRTRNVVTVQYAGLVLRAGDDSEQTPYVLEAWVCQGGEFVFEALGAYGYAIEVVDEPGCAEQSHGRVAAAEKHGYTPFVEVAWPAPEP